MLTAGMVEFEKMVHEDVDTGRTDRRRETKKNDRVTVSEMKKWTPEQYEKYVRSLGIRGFS